MAAPCVLRPPPTRPSIRWAALIVMVVLAGCGGGQRPTLINPEDRVIEPLALDLPPAPADVGPLPPADASLPLESSADDALWAWAADRNVPYVDACALGDTQPGQLCDVATERDTVRLLGPTPDDIWYVVTIEEVISADFGTGFRVQRVDIAGR